MTKQHRHFEAFDQLRRMRDAVDEEEAKGTEGLPARLAPRFAEILGVPCSEERAQQFVDAYQSDFETTLGLFDAAQKRAVFLVEEIGRLVDKALEGQSLEESVEEARLVLADCRELLRLDDVWAKKGLPLIDPAGRQEIEERARVMERDVAEGLRVDREMKRAHRLGERRAQRAPETPMEAPKCVRCERRPRKFGDHCGRCADELGTRPTGKIGAS